MSDLQAVISLVLAGAQTVLTAVQTMWSFCARRHGSAEKPHCEHDSVNPAHEACPPVVLTDTRLELAPEERRFAETLQRIRSAGTVVELPASTRRQLTREAEASFLRDVREARATPRRRLPFAVGVRRVFIAVCLLVWLASGMSSRSNESRPARPTLVVHSERASGAEVLLTSTRYTCWSQVELVDWRCSIKRKTCDHLEHSVLIVTLSLQRPPERLPDQGPGNVYEMRPSRLVDLGSRKRYERR